MEENLISFICLPHFSRYLDSEYWLKAKLIRDENVLYIRPQFMSQGKLYYNCIGEGWFYNDRHPSARPFTDDDVLNETNHCYLMDIKIFYPLDIYTTNEVLDFLKDIPMME